MDVKRFDLGENAVAIVDISEEQANYSTKYSSCAVYSQEKLLIEAGVREFFHDRVDVGCVHEDKIAVIRDLSFGEERNRICGYDGAITDVSGVPLFLASGDCLIMMVAGKNAVGILHCSLKTIDMGIVEKFFDKFSNFDNLSDLRIGFGPYISRENFVYEYLNIGRTDLDDCIQRGTPPLLNTPEAATGIRQGQEGEKEKYYIDLRAMVLKDLESVGILESQVEDSRLDTYMLSRVSGEIGGFNVSHKHFVNEGGREGRVGQFVVKKF